MKILFSSIFILFYGLCFSQNKAAITNDSIKCILNSNKTSLQKIEKLNKLCEDFWLTGNYKEAKIIVDQVQSLEDNELKKSPTNKELLKEQAYTFNNLAIIHRFQGNYSASLDNHLKALSIRETINDVRGIARSNLGLGTIYEFMGKYETALSYKLKAKKLFEQVKDTAFVAYAANHIAGIYFTMGKIKEAENYNSMALLLFIKTNNFTGMQDAFTQAGAIFEYQKKYTDAINNYKGSLQGASLFGLKDRVIGSNIDLGRIYIKMNNPNIANEYLKEALLLSKETGSKLHLSEIHLLFFKRDSALHDYHSALINYQIYVRYQDSLINQKSSEEIAKLQLQFEGEKIEQIKKLEEKQKETARKDKEYKQQLLLYSVSGGLALVLIFLVFVFRSYIQKQKINKELLFKNEIIEKQKHLVEEKHKEITDSINYAERIQRSFLATKGHLDGNLNEYFILFKPKDVVSGDFYWSAALNNGLFALVTADSTGHGVPGAIMSLLNISSLEKAIETNIQPADILNSTRKTIIERLKKDGSEEGGKDGMDASLIVFDFKNKKLTVAAANNSVWIVRGSETIEIKPDKMPIGKHDKDSISFIQQEVYLQSGDVVYTLTDGFPDQFGGEKGKKFMSKNLRELLASNAYLPMDEQKQLLEKTFTNWIGNMEQVDDVAIIGIRI